jgi:hypothetical protein
MRIRSSPTAGRWRRWAATLAVAFAGGVLWIGPGQATAAPSTTSDEVTIMAGCDNHPGVPDWFYPVLRRAAANTHDAVPSAWGNGDKGRAMMKIVCNESSFNVGAYNSAGPYYGLGQLGRPAIDASRVRFACYWHVDNDCSHNRRYYQCLAALRYAKQRYGGPLRAWGHWKNHGWW